jgi:hypothetical protein
MEECRDTREWCCLVSRQYTPGASAPDSRQAARIHDLEPHDPNRREVHKQYHLVLQFLSPDNADFDRQMALFAEHVRPRLAYGHQGKLGLTRARS